MAKSSMKASTISNILYIIKRMVVKHLPCARPYAINLRYKKKYLWPHETYTNSSESVKT